MFALTTSVKYGSPIPENDTERHEVHERQRRKHDGDDSRSYSLLRPIDERIVDREREEPHTERGAMLR
jgi:hypothetical protein